MSYPLLNDTNVYQYMMSGRTDEEELGFFLPGWTQSETSAYLVDVSFLISPLCRQWNASKTPTMYCYTQPTSIYHWQLLKFQPLKEVSGVFTESERSGIDDACHNNEIRQTYIAARW